MSQPTRSLSAALLRLAWPVALSRLGVMGMGVVDVIVVGQLATHELSWQALGWAPTGVALVGGIGLLTGVQVLAARAIGAGRSHEAGGAWRRGLVLSVVAGMMLAIPLWLGVEALLRAFGIAPALAKGASGVAGILAFSLPFHFIYTANTSFLEAIQRPLPSTLAMWLANAVNLALNLVLVPEFGAAGSAMATVASRAFLALALALYIWFLRDAEALGVRRRAHAPTYADLLRIGGASAVSQVAEAGAFSAMTVFAGRIGEAAVATYQILLQQMAVVFMIALGFATAAAVLVSDAIGRGAPHAAQRAGWTGIGVNAVAMLICAGLITSFAHPIARAFTADIAIAALVATLAPFAALALTPDGGQVVAAQTLRARGDNWFPTASHVFAYVVVMPSLAWLLCERGGQGVAGLMIAIVIASILSFGVLIARFWFLGRRA